MAFDPFTEDWFVGLVLNDLRRSELGEALSNIGAKPLQGPTSKDIVLVKREDNVVVATVGWSLHGIYVSRPELKPFPGLHPFSPEDIDAVPQVDIDGVTVVFCNRDVLSSDGVREMLPEIDTVDLRSLPDNGIMVRRFYDQSSIYAQLGSLPSRQVRIRSQIG